MKSILFLTENYYPRVSGVPVVVQYLAEGLIERGYNVSVCTKWYEGLPNKENINGVYVYRFRLYKTLTKRYVGEIDAYRKFVLSLDADVVIFECSECVTTDVLLRNLTQLRGKKIFHSHGFAGMRLLPFRWNVNFKYITHLYLRNILKNLMKLCVCQRWIVAKLGLRRTRGGLLYCKIQLMKCFVNHQTLFRMIRL